MSELAGLAGMIVRATGAKRVLEIGTGRGEAALAIAEALPADGMLITLERDATIAAAARQVLAAAGYSTKVSVMIGDATRFLHKIAGPFDVVLQDGDTSQYARLHGRLIQLLAPGATLLTHNVSETDGYNEVLRADERIRTVRLQVGGGVAVSVRARHEEPA